MTGKHEAHKAVVKRLIDEVMNEGHLDTIDELHTPEMAVKALAWIEPFRKSFREVEMKIVNLVAEDDAVAARFACREPKPESGWASHQTVGVSATWMRFTSSPSRTS